MINTKHILTVIAALFLVGCETTSERNSAFASNDPGPKPENHEQMIREWILPRLKDPESARLRFEPLTNGRYRSSGFSPWVYCWHAKVWVNAKNSYGGYTGEQPYWFSIRDGQIQRVTTPNMMPQSQWSQP
jgi:hypothetical protein